MTELRLHRSMRPVPFPSMCWEEDSRGLANSCFFINLVESSNEGWLPLHYNYERRPAIALILFWGMLWMLFAGEGHFEEERAVYCTDGLLSCLPAFLQQVLLIWLVRSDTLQWRRQHHHRWDWIAWLTLQENTNIDMRIELDTFCQNLSKTSRISNSTTNRKWKGGYFQADPTKAHTCIWETDAKTLSVNICVMTGWQSNVMLIENRRKQTWFSILNRHRTLQSKRWSLEDFDAFYFFRFFFLNWRLIDANFYFLSWQRWESLALFVLIKILLTSKLSLVLLK